MEFGYVYQIIFKYHSEIYYEFEWDVEGILWKGLALAINIIRSIVVRNENHSYCQETNDVK